MICTRVSAVEDDEEEEEEEYPKINDYCFSVDISGDKLFPEKRKLEGTPRQKNRQDQGSRKKPTTSNIPSSGCKAKRHAKEAKVEKDDMPTRTSTLPDQKVISILINGGSSINIIQLEALKSMNVPEAQIVSKSLVLVGFNGEAKSTIGEIKLPVYIEGEKARDVLEAKEQDVKEVSLDPANPDTKVLIGSNIPGDVEQELLDFLKGRMSTFTWKHEDMAEFERLLKSGMIGEVKFPRWLANVVVVQKKNGKWRVCVDYIDLNEAFPKDLFPLPHIDSMVDATTGHEMLTFIDASSGFPQIQMEPSDQEDTAFMTPTCIYCYTAMPFGLKNAGATYQRSSERCKEFYDILKKNKNFEWDEKHKEAFQALKKYLSSAPLLVKPEDNEPLSLYLAVSRNDVSAVLGKDHEGQQYPVYYVSKSLLDAETRTTIKSQALADFVGGFSNDIQHEADMEVQQLEETQEKRTLFTDGASNVPTEENDEADALANLR
ncbi:hypothetical protein L1987_20505 [Smallanthus sonchifolius]|uniref:Uncharacterized protein n=1 Tax=Smallanthus sonchifolius TaxID=185202 RepID=A0ACB9IUZ1_9ASTR|nr:hypothetical protein L1987_20505 [Smallanthus sonchifolius]